MPFIVFTQRKWLGEIVIAGLESMHIGMIVFMGLVAFGAIMVGADFALLKDDDYRSLRAGAARLRSGLRAPQLGRSGRRPSTWEPPAAMPAGAGPT